MSLIQRKQSVSEAVIPENYGTFIPEKQYHEKALPIGVVLTMAATASEANCVSVLSNETIGKKQLFIIR